MTEPSADAVVQELLAQCLDRIESEGLAAIAAVCSAHPEHAAALRERLEVLRDLGMLPAPGPAAAAREFPERLGDFRLLRRLGSGGMGVVYLAEQESLKRPVALKLIRPEQLYFPGARERFQREVESVSRLTHPGIVPVYLVGEADGVPFFAMEHVAGHSLDETLGRLRGRPPQALTGQDLMPQAAGQTWVQACFALLLQMAEAVQHAHDRGVLHRDLKPSNVMLHPDGRAVLLDFGLASIEGADRLTRTGSAPGSLPYMAPEQIDGHAERIGPHTDVYALGVTLYELLTLMSPYWCESASQIRARVLAGEAPPLRRRNRAVPRDAETVCLKAMDRDPEQRYATAAALADDLRRFLQFRPVTAARPGLLLRARRYAQRHPARAATVGLLALVASAAPIAYRLVRGDAARTVQSSLQVVDDLLREVGFTALQDVPRMDEVRARLLEKALTFFTGFLADKEHDAQLLARAADVAAALGNVLQALARDDESEQRLLWARDTFARLAAQHPREPRFLRGHALALYALGYLQRGRLHREQAEPFYRDSAAVYARLIQVQPDTVGHQVEAAMVAAGLAILQQDAGQNAAAGRALRAVIETLEPILAAHPERADARYQLALCWQNLGAVFLGLNRLPEAEDAITKALELHGQLPRDWQDRAGNRRDLGVAWRNLASARELRGDTDRAIAALGTSAGFRDGLARDFPGRPDALRDQANAHGKLGRLLQRLRRFGEAEMELRAATEAGRALQRLRPGEPAASVELALNALSWRQCTVQLEREPAPVLAECEDLLPRIWPGLGRHPALATYWQAAFAMGNELIAVEDFAGAATVLCTLPALPSIAADWRLGVARLLARCVPHAAKDPGRRARWVTAACGLLRSLPPEAVTPEDPELLPLVAEPEFEQAFKR